MAFSIRYDDIYLLGGARTPFGKFCGTLSAVSPTDLGILAGRAALERAGVAPEDIDHVTFAGILPGGYDAIYLPRHVGLYCDVPLSVPALGVQRICGSGFEAVIAAAEQITLGKATAVLAGGSENMSLAPTVSFGNRSGYRLGRPAFGDLLWEGLIDPASGCSMGQTAENLARAYRIPREDIDAYALRSHALARERTRDGTLAEEMIVVRSGVLEREGLAPREYRTRPGGAVLDRDEHVRPTDAAQLARLKPAFTPDGVQTAGNSSGIVDGAAALIVASGRYAAEKGRSPLARLVASASAGVEPRLMGLGPVPAIRQALEAASLSLNDVDLFEINEAFGAQIIAVEQALELDRDKLNVNGGAIAIGHPLAATGARLTLTLALELRRRGARYGMAAACIGGGQGTALLLENPDRE